jgi:biopolymer transport protein ExbB/TolQ
MDYLAIFRSKIWRFREEIASIQELNRQFRRAGGKGTGLQVAHGQRSERLQQIQRELLQLAHLGRKVVPIEPIKADPLPQLHSVRHKPAA